MSTIEMLLLERILTVPLVVLDLPCSGSGKITLLSPTDVLRNHHQTSSENVPSSISQHQEGQNDNEAELSGHIQTVNQRRDQPAYFVAPSTSSWQVSTNFTNGQVSNISSASKRIANNNRSGSEPKSPIIEVLNIKEEVVDEQFNGDAGNNHELGNHHSYAQGDYESCEEDCDCEECIPEVKEEFVDAQLEELDHNMETNSQQISFQPDDEHQLQEQDDPYSMQPYSPDRSTVCRYPDCGKSFSNVKNRQRHESSIHAGIRPFSCTFCTTYTSAHESNVARHIRLVHWALPATYKQQLEEGIVDDRDAKLYVRAMRGYKRQKR